MTKTQLSLSALPEGLQITGVAMINLREQPGLQVCVTCSLTSFCSLCFSYGNG